MPLIIAFLAYGVLTALAFAAVAVIALARGRRPGWAVLAGTVGSLAGFLFGCAVGVLACVAGLASGSGVGATALVVPAGLVGALLGAAVGVAAQQTWSWWNSPKEQRHTEPGAAADSGA